MFTGLRRKSTAIVATAVGSLVLAGSAAAALNTWYDLPDYGGDGDAKVTSIYDPSNVNSWAANGTVSYTDTGSYCTYVQYKPTATWALDGDWKRLNPSSSDACSSTRRYYDFHREAFLAYDGIKFRLCQNKPNAGDPCGSESANIKR